MRACTICSDERRAAIDADLRSGAATRATARKYSLTEPTLRRHRQHLDAASDAPLASGLKAGPVLPAAPSAPMPPVPPIPHGQAAFVWPPPQVLAQLKADLDAGKLTGPYADQAPSRPASGG